MMIPILLNFSFIFQNHEAYFLTIILDAFGIRLQVKKEETSRIIPVFSLSIFRQRFWSSSLDSITKNRSVFRNNSM